MSNASHTPTPGPWHLDPNGYVWAYGPEQPSKLLPGVTEKRSVTIANLQSNPNIRGDMSLIAAAPAMLAALRGILRVCEAGDPQAAQYAKTAAAAAIAKAEGA